MMMQKLLELLDCDTAKELIFLECLGNLTLMLHWQRGIIDSLIRDKVIKLGVEQKMNWDRVIRNLELYEEFMWEVVPSRAMLLVLREFRRTGKIPDNYEELIKKDSHGRIPYGLTSKELDDIEDIIRRIKDSRQTTGFGHAYNLLNS